MANLLERVQNVFDNHQDRDSENAREQAYRQALYETRDALLGSAVGLKDDWSNELTRTRTDSHPSIHARYEARVQGLNDDFAVLHQGEPGITTQLSPEEFRESATRQAQARSYEAPERQHSPYHYAYAATRQQLDTEYTQREARESKHEFIDNVTAAANRHLGIPYPSDDRQAGIRQATVDWAHEHNPELLFARGAQRPILNHDQYQAGYDSMKETLDRKWEAWQSASQQSRVTPSKEMERQAACDMALEASRSVRDNWGDRGRGPERLDDPDFDCGSRKALMDWSHEHNHRHVQEQQRARGEELSRSGQEYGISY